MSNDKFILMGLDDERSKDIAEVLGNKTCKKIIDHLAETKEASEKDISDALGIPINTVEYNLNKLIKTGLVEKTKNFFWSRKGKKIDMYKLAKKHIVISPKPKRVNITELKAILPVILVAAIVIAIVLLSVYNLPGNHDNNNPVKNNPADNNTNTDELKQFSSIEQMKDFLKASQTQENSANYATDSVNRVYNTVTSTLSGSSKASMQAAPSAAGAGSEVLGTDTYSHTNVQVEGVDEADIVKNDGKYIYTLSGDKVVIVNAYPADNMGVLSELNINGAKNLYINGDKLIIFSESYEYFPYPYPYQGDVMCRGYPCGGGSEQTTNIFIYNIKDRNKPILTYNFSIEGNYQESRMINDYIYLISSKSAYYDNPRPILYEVNGVSKEMSLNDVYYFDHPDYSYMFDTISAINIDSNEINSKSYLVGGSGSIYVSENNIYLSYQKRINHPYVYGEYRTNTEITDSETTFIHKISIDKLNINYKDAGEVTGHVLNQFSMDEYDGYFRIATTTGQITSGNSLNHVFVLDENMNTVGSLKDLAHGEKIYSARFIGKRAYLVTFKKVDPFYVIDLSDVKNPKVLGYLKIPGYSDYLHPYDETHIIGIGKEAIDASTEEVEARNLDFAWYQGVKIALFDVSDVNNPKEVSKFIIGDRGTDSLALTDHKAFLFDKDKNLLVIPVNLAMIDKSKYENTNCDSSYNCRLNANTYGEQVWQGAYALNIDLDNGITLKGKITHFDNSSYNQYSFYDSRYQIKRSLFMDNTLYTISESKIKANSLSNMDEIKTIDLGLNKYPEENPVY